MQTGASHMKYNGFDMYGTSHEMFGLQVDCIFTVRTLCYVCARIKVSLAFIKEVKFKFQMGERTPPDELIQMAIMKVAPKIPVVFLKSLINECDHMKSDVIEFPCSLNFQKFKQDLEIN